MENNTKKQKSNKKNKVKKPLSKNRKDVFIYSYDEGDQLPYD